MGKGGKGKGKGKSNGKGKRNRGGRQPVSVTRLAMAEHFTSTEGDWALRNELPNAKMADHNVLFSTDQLWHDGRFQPACVACQSLGHTAGRCAEHKRRTQEAMNHLGI